MKKTALLHVTFLLALIIAGCGQPTAPKKTAPPPVPPPKPIALDTSVKSGKELFALHCQSCHGEEGQGVAQIFPQLAGSARLASGKYFIHGLIHGYPPPSDPTGSPWMGEMPKFSTLSDEELAKLTNYVRERWGGAQDVVTVEMVAEQRAAP